MGGTGVPDAGREPGSEPADAAARIAAWHSYLIGDTTVLRNLPELTDQDELTVYERGASHVAQAALLVDHDRPRSLDLAHLSDVHRRLFADVYPFAGQLRYVDTALIGQSTSPFVHHEWIPTYTAEVITQLRAEDNLTRLADPGQWADRATYYWTALLHAHPYREGNGRAIRVWLTDLAETAGHTLDWTRSDTWRNHLVGIMAGGQAREPMRALLTAVAGGTVGIDRPAAALDDLDAMLERQAWARTGMVVGSEQDKAVLPAELRQLKGPIADTYRYLADQPVRQASRQQPAADRWRGLVASHYPGLVTVDRWPAFAGHLDVGAVAGYDMADELSALSPGARPEEVARRLEPAPPPTLAERRPGGFEPPPPPARGIRR